MAKRFLVFFTLFLTLFSYSELAVADDAKENMLSYYNDFDDDDFDDEDFESYESISVTTIYDPFEYYNRKIFAFNDAFDRYFLEHLAKEYRKRLPKPVRNVVRNFLTNLSLPISTVNSLLQGKGQNSLASFSHFLINSTIGIGGLFDVAGHKGVIYQKEDFGQTLGHYGVKAGPYLVLPFFGPSSGRDFGGMIVDKSVNPVEFNMLEFGGKKAVLDEDLRIFFAGVSGLDKREALIDVIDDVRKDSFDLYATLRSAYLQQRKSDIQH